MYPSEAKVNKSRNTFLLFCNKFRKVNEFLNILARILTYRYVTGAIMNCTRTSSAINRMRFMFAGCIYHSMVHNLNTARRYLLHSVQIMLFFFYFECLIFTYFFIIHRLFLSPPSLFYVIINFYFNNNSNKIQILFCLSICMFVQYSPIKLSR